MWTTLLTLLGILVGSQAALQPWPVAMVVMDDTRPPGTIANPNYLGPDGSLYQLFVLSYQLWNERITTLGGIPSGANRLLPQFTYLNYPLSSNETRNAQIGMQLVASIGNTTRVIVLPFGLPCSAGLFFDELCETTARCVVIHSATTDKSCFICLEDANGQLPADCQARNRAPGQRRHQHTLSALYSSDNVMAGKIDRMRLTKSKTLAMVAVPTPFGVDALSNSVKIAASFKIEVTHAIVLPGPFNSPEEAQELIRNISLAQPDELIVFATTMEAIYCANITQAMKALNYMPKSVGFGGGCVAFMYPYVGEDNRYFFGATPWDPRVRGEDYRSIPSIYAVEPWASTAEDDIPQVYAKSMEARWGMTNIDALVLSSLGAQTMYMMQRIIETANVDNPSGFDLQQASTQLSAVSLHGRLRLDNYGRAAAEAQLLTQTTRNNGWVMITPVSSGVEPIHPIPTWSERVFQPGFYQRTDEQLVLAGTTLCILYNLGLLWFVYKHERTNIIRAATPLFCYIMLVGGVLLLATNYVWTLHQTDLTCTLRIWFLQLGFTTMYGAIFIRTVRLWLIFYRQELTVLHINNRTLAKIFSVLLAFDVVYTLIWMLVDPMRAQLVEVDPDRPAFNYYTCQVTPTTNVFAGIAMGLKIVGIGLGLLVCFLSRKMPLRFNETKYIASTIWGIAVMALIGVPIVVANNTRESVFHARSYAIMALDVMTMSFIFLPKVSIILSGDKTALRNPNDTMLGQRPQEEDNSDPISRAVVRGVLERPSVSKQAWSPTETRTEVQAIDIKSAPN